MEKGDMASASQHQNMDRSQESSCIHPKSPQSQTQKVPTTAGNSGQADECRLNTWRLVSNVQKPQYKWSARENIIYTLCFQRAAKHCSKMTFLSPFDKLCIHRINLKLDPWRLSKATAFIYTEEEQYFDFSWAAFQKGTFLPLKCTKKCHISQRSISPPQQEH